MIGHESLDASCLNLIHITDTHLMDRVEAEFVQMNPEQSFRAVMDDILSRYPKIDAIIHTGDLAQKPVPETYQRYLSFMQQLNIPFYQVPGNHDDVQHFPFYEGKNMPFAIEFGNWCVILLNSAVPNQVDGWIDQADLEHLDRLLQQHQHQHIMLACHHHPFEMHSHWIDQHKLKNTPQLMDVLSKYPHIKLSICGHVHQDSTQSWNGIAFLSTPSTCVQFKPLSYDFALDDIAPGYRMIQLQSNGQFQTQIHRLENFLQHINKEISGY